MRGIARFAAYWWIPLLVLGLGLIYLPGLGNDLIFDDEILTDGTVFEGYGSPLAVKARSLSYGSFVWIRTLFGEEWLPQRLTNLGLHLATALLLFALTRRALDQVGFDAYPPVRLSQSRDCAAGAATLLFALNPVAVYAVAYLAQRSILMATFFSAAALLAVIRAAETMATRWWAVAVFCYGLAILSKEHALLLPLPALLVFLMAAKPSRRTMLLSLGGSVIVLALAAFFVGLAYQGQGLIGKVIDEDSVHYLDQLSDRWPSVRDLAYPLSIFNQGWLFFKYGVLWLIPNVQWMAIDLRPPFPTALSSLPQAFGIPLFILMATLALVGFLRFADWRRLVALGVLVPMSLFSTEFAIVWIQDPFVLYRSYLWALGLPLLLSPLLVWLGPKSAIVLGGIGACILVPLSVDRVQSLRDAGSAWADAAAKVDLRAGPEAVGRWRPLVNHGNHQLQSGAIDLALIEYGKAQSLGDRNWVIDFQLGLALAAKGQLDRAIDALERAETGGGSKTNFHLVSFHRGLTLSKAGRCEEAMPLLESVLPKLGDQEARVAAMGSVAQCRVRLGDARGAVGVYREIVSAYPGERSAQIGLAMALFKSGDKDAAMEALDQALKEGDTADVRTARAILLRETGQVAEAAAEVTAGLARSPGDRTLLGLERSLARIRAENGSDRATPRRRP
jgi:tetratricopeptide (TPR) repeat protein